ncbi:ADP-ribosylglycohydrolase family protein [Myxococcus llanfairpwllgwyngyllgogerychwyrndrobwllllantysiliogogogochensis]|uniref:ADP-ribosylglycohydrolase family protein n=1 Tax=Myxococcus llanfairpwllgwyngyllgogerychwyrndrobwllllantysiliogogogochensis TaxID=2590453 RepID=A0A540WK77_9BACT|nr:ADP-ribosylglycohydrolase family protein [Myxococcus llanfairpwllgwyngyllgogerychwyrndrobwllllantysiliogogogochensis]TQF09413.1 ADP-ribosylglycohydrolase family protein [Myxococcus llanfairpwllgwyngyllgogerychwyrndrobwllllantysiliogogogochensis]
MVTREERIEGGLLGLLVGDALGVPYEFHPSERIPSADAIEFEPPAGFGRSHPDVPPGTWSDDGAHALCLLDSLLYQGRLDLEDLGRRLVNWREWGYLAVDGQVFDVGIQTDRALSMFRAGVPGTSSGPSGQQDNGNGSLMRVLPLALWHRGTDAELASDAMLQSLVTHGHLRSRVCCALYCLWARRALEGLDRPWDAALEAFRALHPEGTEARTELDDAVLPRGAEDTPGRGSGYVVDCLRSARDCVAAGGGYEQVVRAAVRLGNDTDTTAAVAGGVAGVLLGARAIPERWRSALRGRELLEPLLRKLLVHAAR